MKQLINTIIISVGIIIAAAILGNSWKRTHIGNGTISVNGIAKLDIVSDLIMWQGYLSEEAKDTKTAYAQLKKDTGVFKKYLVSKGIKEKEIIFSSVEVHSDYEDDFSNGKQGFRTKKLKGYVLTQDVKIESKDVDKVEDASREVSELIDLGVNFVEETTEYYYTKLDELKIKLISSATEEAHKRALAITTNSDSKLGNLERSDMSTFDVTAKNSVQEFSEAGHDDYYNNETYNTSSKDKTAKVTVKLEFGIL